ncbi:ester cyclase [Streptomyces sp. NPDC006879]|uniref:ester cyclase n=1 Tax=Streptomyces sp. NPDC006879 TaxID=3364767 RepID=UPI0036C46BD5
MTFVQIIDYETHRPEDLNAALDRWLEQSDGKRTATHSMVGKDLDSATHFVDVVEFPSYEAAMRNSALPETDRMFKEMVALCDGMPQFTNLDVVRDENLNKVLVNRTFDAIAAEDGFAFVEECFAEGYVDHDIMPNTSGATGREIIRHDVGMWRDAFDFSFTMDRQVAEGDSVATLWTWTGVHRGEFMGVAPTGKECTMTGCTVFRIADGQIAEGWWQFDAMSLMRQLGMTES